MRALIVILQIFLCLAEKKDEGLVVSLVPNYLIYGAFYGFEGNPPTLQKKNRYSSSEYGVYSFRGRGEKRDDTHIISMDSCGKGKLYFMDGISKTLYSLNSFNIWMNKTDSWSDPNVIHKGISHTISTRIAYDCQSENIYWTDALMNWIAVQPVNTTDKTVFTPVVDKRLSIPGAVAVDPYHGYLFWSDHGSTTLIERSTLTGKNRKVIVSNLRWVPDIKADSTEQRLYWVDNENFRIESSDYNGQNRRPIYISTNYQMYVPSISIFTSVVCFAEYKEEKLYCVDKQSGIKEAELSITWSDPWATTSHGISGMVSTDYCAQFGCDDICVNTPNGAECLCREGYDLQGDKKSCKAKHTIYGKSFMIANVMGGLCSLDIRVLVTHKSEVNCFLNWTSEITHLAVDTESSRIFFADASQQIVEYDLVEKKNYSLISTGKVSGLVYSWDGSLLYWSESDTGVIKEMSVDNINNKVKVDKVLFSGIIQPHNLTVNPHNSTLFWFSYSGNKIQIEAGSFSGHRWMISYSAPLVRPSGLFFDVGYNVLFWINNKHITFLHGSGDMVDQLPAGKNTQLLIYKKYAITTTGKDIFNVTNLHDVNGKTVVDIKEFGRISAFAVFDSALQVKDKGKCEVNNGGCKHMCIPDGLQGTCECGFGYTLDTDKHNCSAKFHNDNFALTVDYRRGMIYQLSLDNPNNIGVIDLPRPAAPLSAIFNAKDKNVYWADIKNDQILRTSLDGKHTKLVYTNANYVVYSLTIDPSTGNIYYTGAAYTLFSDSMIGVIHHKSYRHKAILSKIGRAWSVAVYPSKGYVFWVDGGGSLFSSAPAGIGRAQMDGSHPRLLYTKRNGETPNALAIDYSTDSIYWTDSSANRIKRIGIDGLNPTTISYHEKASLAHLAIAGQFIYFTATSKQEVTKIHKDSGTAFNNWMKPVTEFGRLETITLHTPGADIPVHSGCAKNNGQCSTFCFPLPNNEWKCGCPDGISLLGDYKTCFGVPKCHTVIQNGHFNEDCSPYVNGTCNFTCNSGYEKLRGISLLTCDSKLRWVVGRNTPSLTRICIPSLKPTKSTATSQPVLIPQKLSQTSTSGVDTGVFAAVIVVLILIFVAFVFGLMFFMQRRRQNNMFGHAKFVNSPNVTDINVRNDSAPSENKYTTIIDVPGKSKAGPSKSPPEGMENPLYKVKNTDNATMSEQEYKSVDVSSYKF